jgi:hypothetical protein
VQFSEERQRKRKRKEGRRRGTTNTEIEFDSSYSKKVLKNMQKFLFIKHSKFFLKKNKKQWQNLHLHTHRAMIFPDQIIAGLVAGRTKWRPSAAKATIDCNAMHTASKG